ncbi:MAG: 30S ribosomal protein S20 [Ignavibacteriales bacterium]|nr:30S ribosomal protein S20 [Ignavibacteriales bacterium]
MPQHKSAEKRIRQNARRKVRNKARLSRMKTLIKKVRSAKEKKEAEIALKTAVQYLDRLAAKGVIHRNKAANQKSKLTRLVRAVK